MVTAFGNFEFDDRLFQLRHHGVPVALPRKAFDLLGLLIRNRDRVVTKEEIFETLWDGTVVGETSLTSCVNTLRHAFRVDGEAHRLVQTVHGRGYRFAPPVRLADPPPSPESDDRRSPVLGRATEIGVLESLVHDLANGRGHIVLISGESGIGKTRLADEAAGLAQAHGALVLIGAGHQDDTSPAYWPWIEAIRQLTGAVDDGTLEDVVGLGAADIAQLVPSIAARLPRVPGTLPSSDAAQSRLRLFESVTALFARAAARRPIVLVLEDLHWLDPASLLLLDFIARETERAPLLVVGTFRETEAPVADDIAARLAGCRRDHAVRWLPLSGLSPGVVHHLVEHLSGGQMPPSMAAAIGRVTGGNPLFVSAMVEHLRGETEALCDANPDLAEQVALRHVPDGITSIISRRLARCSDSCQRVLRIAAALGREFSSYELACTNADASTADTLDALDEAVALRIIVEQPAPVGTFAFVHALFREVLYRNIGMGGRRRLHRQIAEHLEALYATNLDDHLAELAHHYGAAMPHPDSKAVEFATRAGERAAALMAYDTAVGCFRRALEFLDGAAHDVLATRAHLLLSLGQAHGRAGHTTEARAVFAQAAAIARRSKDGRSLALAALGCGARHLRHFGIVDRDAVAVLEEADEHLGAGESVLHAQLWARLALALRYDPASAERRVTLGHGAVDLARRAGDRRVLASVLDDTLWALWRADNLDARLATAAEVLALAGGGVDPELEIRAHGARAVSLLEAGDLVAADAAIARHAALADALRLPVYRWDNLHYQATRALLAGDLDRAHALAESALVARQHDLHDDAQQAVGVMVAVVQHLRGRGLEIIELVAGMRDMHPTCWRVGGAYVLSEYGQLDVARAEYDVLAADDFRSLPQDSVWLTSMTELAIVAHHLRDAPRAALIYDLLRPYAGRLVITSEYATSCMGTVSRALALAAAAAGWHDVAQNHFDEASTLARRLELRAELPVILVDRALHLAHVPGVAARQRALACIAEATPLARSLGMAQVIERAARVS